MNERVVFVSRRPPYPHDNGSRIRAHRLLAGLGRAFDLTLLTFEHHPDSPDGHCSRDEIQRLLPGIEVVTVPGLGRGKRLRQLASIPSARSSAIGSYSSRLFHQVLRDTVRQRRPALVHFDELAAAQFGPLPGVANVYGSHNIEYHLIRETASAERGPRRWFGELEWRKVRAEERRAWRLMPLCLAVSDLDAAVMRAAGAGRVVVCPNGTDPVECLPPPRRSAGEPLRLLFIGSVSFRPHELGLAWFVREVLPRLREHVPVELDVVGRPPARPLPAEGVSYVGRVPSVRPSYERAHAAIVPLFQVSGTRLKVLEAIAMGRPVVSTPQGAEGLPLSPGQHYYAAQDPEGFVRALVDLASGAAAADPRLDAFIERARSAITPLFWPRITAELVDTYRGEIERSGLTRGTRR